MAAINIKVSDRLLMFKSRFSLNHMKKINIINDNIITNKQQRLLCQMIIVVLFPNSLHIYKKGFL